MYFDGQGVDTAVHLGQTERRVTSEQAWWRKAMLGSRTEDLGEGVGFAGRERAAV